MIKYNPLYKNNGTLNLGLSIAPSESVVFDVPGKCIWVKGVKLKGTNNTYTFSHDNYITLTNTPDPNDSEIEDIKIGVNITTLKAAIDTTYNIVSSTANGLAPKFSVGNFADSSASTSYSFLGLQENTLKWYTLPHRNVYVNATEVQSVSNTDPLKFVAGNGITITWNSTNKCIEIVNSKPDMNHNTDFQVGLYVTSTNSDYRILLKKTANDTEETGTARFATALTFNPSINVLKINGNKVITVVDVYTGATSTENGIVGLVPVATSAQKYYFLRGDGTWAVPPGSANTWRPVMVNNSQVHDSSINSGALNLVLSGTITLTWDETNRIITIGNAAWVGATSSTNGIPGYMPAPTSALRSQFLRGDGTWLTLNNYSLPLAADGVRGGVQIGYAELGRNYAVKLNQEKMYVTVPWEDTTYSNGTGLSLSNDNVFSLSPSGVVAGTYKRVTVDEFGRVTAGDNTDANDNTWRGVYVNGTSKVGNGIDTKAINFASSGNISIAYLAASDYFTIRIDAAANALNTAGYVAAPTSANANMVWKTDSNGNPGWRVDADTWVANSSSAAGYVGIPSATSVWMANSSKVPAWRAVTGGSTTLAWNEEKTIATIGTVDIKVKLPVNPNENTWRPIKVGTTDALGSGTGTGTLTFAAGTGISLSWDSTDKKLIITNSSPDVNHNTDRTSVKLGTISGTKKTDSTLISANSSSGLVIAGGTNKFSIGDGTNYIEIPITISHGLSTKNITINGQTYAIYTSASSLPTIVAPTGFGSANQILATNSSANGFVWVDKPVSNVTTSAVVSSSSTGTSQITAALSNPYYNLLEGGSVAHSIRFVAGNGITISAATDGQITITNSKPDVNHDTHYTTTMYIGESNNTLANATVTSNPYLKLFDNSTRRSTLRFVAGNGISISSDNSGNLTITNTKPDVNHDTHWTTHLYVGEIDTAANKNVTNPYLKLFDNSTLRHQYHISGSGATTVTSDANGNITISSTDTNTNTHYTTSMYIGENNNTKANAVVTSNPYLKLFDDNTRRSTLRFVAGNGITIASDANGNITITNSKPDVNHNTDTHWTSYLRVGAKDTTTTAATSNGATYLKLIENGSVRADQILIKGAGATTVTSDANGIITITSTDTNTNTDQYVNQSDTTTDSYRNVILSYNYGSKTASLTGSVTNVVYSTDKFRIQPSTGYIVVNGGGEFGGIVHLLANQYTDSAGTGSLNLNNSDIYGVNSIKFADSSDGAAEGLLWYRDATHVDSMWVNSGVMYFTPNRTWGSTGTSYIIAHAGNISNKEATIGTSLTTIATIAGVNITAKIGSYAASNHTHSLSIAADSGTSSIALAASTKYKLTAGGSTYVFTSTPDENVKQIKKTDNTNRPLMMINGGTSTGDLTSTSMFSTGMYANASTNTIYATIFNGTVNRAASSVAWVNGRTSALLRETSVSGYHALWSLKTTNGSWDFGEYSTTNWYDLPVLTYITDANFNAGSNTTTYQIKFPLASGTIALTSQIPTVNNASLTLLTAGTTLTTFYANDSTNRTFNVTCANIGASPSNHTHTFAAITNKITNTNEFNFVDNLYATIWFNYRNASNLASTTLTTDFYFGKGNASSAAYAYVNAEGFKKRGSSSAYVLLGDGGHKAVSDFAASGHNHNGTYVKIAGDTMTGALTIKNTSGLTIVDANSVHDTWFGWVTYNSADYAVNYAYETLYWPMTYGTHPNALTANKGLIYTGSSGSYANRWGIGTFSPGYTLHVNGTVASSGFHHTTNDSNSYVLLAGGGTKAITDFASSGHNHDGVYAPINHEHKRILNYYDSRPTSANVLLGDGYLYQFKATSSMTTGKPAWDAHILHFAWDNTGGWDSQLAIGTSYQGVLYRGLSSGTWGNWITILDSANYTSYVKNASLTLLTAGTTQTTFYANDSTNRTFNVTCANIGAATSSHNHDGRYVIDAGGNITSKIYDIATKSVFSGNNLADAPVTGWVSGLVLGSNWNNNHYQHYLVEGGGRWYTTRSYSNGNMNSWNTFAYLSDIPTKSSWDYDDRYVKKAGDTMTGHLYHDGEKCSIYKIERKKSGGGGWAYSPFAIRGNDNASFFYMGVLGEANALTYGYIGSGAYNSAVNLRIASTYVGTTTLIPNAANSYSVGSSANPYSNLYLGKTNGSGIYYVGTKASYRMIRFIDNTSDTYGNGIAIGGGGLTVLGSGESADTLLSSLSLTASGGSEATYIASDGAINFYPSINSWDAASLIQMTAGRLWVGVNGNTTRENQIGLQSGAGQILMYAHAATSGSRGIWVTAHGTGSARIVFNVDTNNKVTFADAYNGTSTALAYSQAGMSASSITWLTCWNGYELRAISKAEVANCVSSYFLTSLDHYSSGITAGTAGTSLATSGTSISIPYVTVNSHGHVTAYGTHTHTVSVTVPSHTHPFSNITDGTSTSTSSGWSHILSNTYGGSLKSILYMCHGSGYGMHLRGYSTSASIYMLLIYNSSKEVFGIYGDSHINMGGKTTIAADNWASQLVINRTNNGSNWGGSIVFLGSGTNRGAIHMENNTLYVGDAAGTTRSAVLTSLDHYKTSPTAGTAGTSSATSGSTLAVPYIKVNANGHITGYGTHTHTVTGFAASSHSHTWESITSLMLGGNEFNIPDSGFSYSGFWFNYYPRNLRSANSTEVTDYHFGNMKAGKAYLNAKGYKRESSSDSYVLLGGGGHMLLSSASAQRPWGCVVNVQAADGVMEVGRYMDWHYDNTVGSDYSCRIQCQGNNNNVLKLPTGSGTLARIEDIPSSSGSSFSLNHQRVSNTTNRYVLGTTNTNTTSASLNGGTLYSLSAFYFNSNGAYHTSDARVKYDISDILNEDVNELFETNNGFIRHFKWKETDRDAYGFIAQELVRYCPEAVDFNYDNGQYAVDYNVALSKMIGVLFKKIKQQDEEIKKLKEIIENRK